MIFQYHICNPMWMDPKKWVPCPFFAFGRWPGMNKFVIKIWRFRCLI